MREISLMGLSQAVFSLLFILTKPEKSRSDLVLCLWLLVLTNPLFTSVCGETGILEKVNRRFFNPSITLLHGPLLYFYVNEVINVRKPQLKNYLIHAFPFALFYLLFQFISPDSIQAPGPGRGLLLAFGGINAAIFILYSVLTIILVLRHRRALADSFAYTSWRLSLDWVLILPVLFFCYIVFLIIWEQNTGLSAVLEPVVLQQAGFLIMIFYLSFFGLKQNVIYQTEPERETEAEKKADSAKMPDDEESGALIERMNRLMSAEKPYLDPEFSVYDLASSLEISRHKLSALLSGGLSKNFYQFVNEYRLEEIIGRIKADTDNKLTIIEIAYNSGFNSKSSFNSLFKEQYGMTPTAYRKNEKN